MELDKEVYDEKKRSQVSSAALSENLCSESGGSLSVEVEIILTELSGAAS